MRNDVAPAQAGATIGGGLLLSAHCVNPKTQKAPGFRTQLCLGEQKEGAVGAGYARGVGLAE